MKLTRSQTVKAQWKIRKRLKKITSAENAPKHRWRLVKAWLVTIEQGGVVKQRLRAKYRSTITEKGVTRASLRKARIPAYLTINLGLT